MKKNPPKATPKSLVLAIKLVIKSYQTKYNNKDLANRFRHVLEFLPKYPVMAVMEAEAQNLNPQFIKLLQKTYYILPLQ